MRLNQQTDFALRILIYLSVSTEEPVTVQHISEVFAVSKNHLMKVSQKLSRAGYIESVRGKRGGLRLQRQPEDIRVGEVISVMEPDLSLVECQRSGNHCLITPACDLPVILNRGLAAFLAVTNEYTLSDLLPEERSRDLVSILQVQ